MDYAIEIRRHALIRAMQRGIDPDQVEAAINGGKREYFGKNYIRFTMQYKSFKVICIGEICGLKIKITKICPFNIGSSYPQPKVEVLRTRKYMGQIFGIENIAVKGGYLNPN